MTLIEALKSGRRFRLGLDGEWLENAYGYGQFSIEQVLADDWELEPVSVTITRETLAVAWTMAFDAQGGDEVAWDRLCRELGL